MLLKVIMCHREFLPGAEFYYTIKNAYREVFKMFFKKSVTNVSAFCF